MAATPEQPNETRGLFEDSGSAARILAVATEWRSRHGGLSTFNRGLCAALASAGQQVVCLVPEFDIEEQLDASAQGVTLLAAIEELGASEAVRLRRRPQVGDVPADVIIGHGRVTGPQARAIRDDFFPAARRVHVVHTYAGHIEWFKRPKGSQSRTQNAAEREALEQYLAGDADVVAAVGPLLAREAAGLLQRPVVELLPGLTEDRDAAMALPPTVRCLLAGRAEDSDLKGLDIAATAFSHLDLPQTAGNAPQLVVRGAPLDGADDLADTLGQLAGSRLKIHVAPYTDQPQALGLEMSRATLAIMPSRREGFGLVGLEAIDAGVPVLVSANSGLGELLADLGGPAAACVVPVHDDLDIDGKAWAAQIAHVLKDRSAAFQRAAEVRKQVAERCAWQTAAEAILDALGVKPRDTAQAGTGEPTFTARQILPRVPSFAGREAELASIESRLRVAGGHVEVLTGPAGIGKTALATELAWRRRESHRVVWTLHGVDGTTLTSDLSALADALGIADAGDGTRANAQRATSWLHDNRDWLLVIDDVGRLSDVAEHVPLDGHGTILVTTRQGQDWNDLGEMTVLHGTTTVLGGFARRDAIDFIVSKTGDPDIDAASALADLYEGVPLALAMAASIIDETGLRTRDVIEAHGGDEAGREAAEIVNDVLRVVRRELAERPLALDLFNLFAFFATEPIPPLLLETFVPFSGGAAVDGDMTVYDAAIGVALSYAVMVQMDGGYVMHPTVAASTRRELGEDARAWASQAAEVVLEAINEAPVELAERLVPHALAACGFAIDLGPPAGPASRFYGTVVMLSIRACELFLARGQSGAAEQAIERLPAFLSEPDAREADPMFTVAVRLAQRSIAIARADQQAANAFAVSAASGTRVAFEGTSDTAELSCQAIAFILGNIDTADDEWYRVLAFPALAATRLATGRWADLTPRYRADVVKVRLWSLAALAAHDAFDDVIAASDLMLDIDLKQWDWGAFKTTVEISAAALESLGDEHAASARRARAL